MYTPETRILSGNEAQRRGRTRTRNRLIGATLIVATVGSGWWVFQGVQEAHAQHQRKIDQAVGDNTRTIRGLITAPYASRSLIHSENGPKVIGCKPGTDTCQVSAHATYESPDIHSLTTEIDAELDAKGLRVYSGAVGTQNSLRDTADQTSFVLEYGRPNGSKESIDGTQFSWHAILDCRVSGLNGVPTSEAATNPTSGVCALDVQWVRDFVQQGTNP